MGKKTLTPGKEFGSIRIPKDVFVEVEECLSREEEMQIHRILQILTNHAIRPQIKCSCGNSDFLWLLENHQRGEKKNKEKEFVFKVQLTCKKCTEVKSLDIGPTIEFYQKIGGHPTTVLKQWAEEISKICNDHFQKIRRT